MHVVSLTQSVKLRVSRQAGFDCVSLIDLLDPMLNRTDQPQFV